MSNSHIFGSVAIHKSLIAAIFAVFGLLACSAGSENVDYNPSGTPSLTLSATPSLIASGATSIITWSSTNSNSCTSSGGGGTGTSGSFTTPALTATTAYVVTCTGPGGIVSMSTTVTIATEAPVVTVLATPSSIEYGAISVITWWSANSTSCTSSWGGNIGTAGSFTTPALTVSKTYTVICTGPIGTGSDSKMVTVKTAPIPVVTLSASQSTIISGATTIISWSSINASSCISSGGGGTGVSGSFTTPPLTATTNYIVTCTDLGGSASQSVTVTVVAAPVPVVTLTATPSSIASGATTVIGWSSTNATSCISSGGGGTGTSGTFTTPALFANTIYTVTCTDGGGSASQNITVTVAAAPVPVVTLTATPTSIISGTTSVLNWTSVNSTSCTSSGGGGTGTTGTFTTPVLTVTTIYTVTCTGLGGTTASQSTTVTVTAAPVPVVTLSASPTSIINGSTTVITWSSTNSTSCISPSGAVAGTSGTYITPALTVNTIYTVTCTGGGGSASQIITITVAPALPTVTLTATPASIISGTTSVLNWTSTNSTSCISPSGAVAGTTGSFTTPALYVTTVYTMTCTGPGGTTAIQSTTVTVTAASSVPVVNVVATPSSIINGATSVITWTSSNSTSCTSSGGGGTGTSGTFTTPSLTATTAYTVTCTGSGGTASQIATVTVASGLCVTTGDIANISLPAVIPSRLTGVAPLSVFFESLVTSATSTTRPFHDLEHRWDFGDQINNVLNRSPPAPIVGGTSTWNMGSKPGVNSRNTATGPVAAHVYETAGTYPFRLTVTDGTHTVSNICTQIVVQDPNIVFSGSNTICVAATSLPVQNADGCPAGANTAQQPNFATAISSYAKTGKRVLFKHDDTFTESGAANIAANGPGIIGMYGAGAKPKILPTSAYAIVLGAPAVLTMQDWRIMDLEFDGQSNAGILGVIPNGDADQITLLRLYMHDMGSGISLDADNIRDIPGAHIFDQFTVADSTFTVFRGSIGWYIYANHLALLGNYVNDTNGGTAQHVVRIMHSAKGVISNNTFGNPSPTHQAFTLRGVSYSSVNCNAPTGTGQCLPEFFPYGSYAALTSQTVISDNHFIAGNTQQPVTVEPSDINYFDTRFKDIILERNWYTATAGGSCCIPMLKIGAQDVTVRNEVMDMTTGGTGVYKRGIAVQGAGTVSPASNNVRLYNNTVFGNDSFDFQSLQIQAGATNVSVVNNIFYSPNFSGTVNTTNAVVASNNSTTTSISPNLAVVPPTSPVDFKITAGSYAIGAGAAVPVWSDFFLTPITAASTRDMGAVMH